MTIGTFELSNAEIARAEKWKKEVAMPMAISIQKARLKEAGIDVENPGPDYSMWKFCWDQGFAYGGVSGGQFTYSFTPTSLGDIATIKCVISGEELTLTDFMDW